MQVFFEYYRLFFFILTRLNIKKLMNSIYFFYQILVEKTKTLQYYLKCFLILLILKTTIIQNLCYNINDFF